jgi:hypothetical protein
MKKMFFLTVLMAGTASFAQTTTSNMPADVGATSGAATSAAQVQTSTGTLPTAAATSTKKWGGAFYIQAFTDVRDQQRFGSKASTYSDNYIGANYALSDKLKLEMGYNFSVVSGKDNPNFDSASFHNNYEGRSPEIILKQTLGRIGDSDPVAINYYYYFPMGLYTEQAGGNGILRIDATTTWNFRKVSISPYLSERTYLNNSVNKETEAVYRFNIGPSFAYNVSDAFNAYYTPYTDVRSSDLNRGKLSFNKKNLLVHEMGVNWNTKIADAKVTVNPALVNYQHLENGQGLGRNYYASNDGKETNTAEVDLNIFTTF